MKIKIKGTDKVRNVTPNEWSVIEKNGQTSEYEIIERNTVWAGPIDSNGNVVESQKREFELDHWYKMLDLGSRNKWKRIDNEQYKIQQQELKEDNLKEEEPKKEIKKDKSLEISELQFELTQAQIEKTKAETDLTKEKTKDLKRKFLYFIGGVLVGNIDTILKLFGLLE
ncbi:hypothetical protein [Tenacibaculum geojense]|uniref:Uncharacterized protein n=1 Tax=Tenacibaculum geojense TaxID=915352 RepID=A0ABW3JXY3_9FLAO